MEIWIIAVIVAGGVIVLALFALTIYKCCCRRPNRKNDKRDAKEQNGHVWQAHDKDVELGDEEDPRRKMKEDGLCEETNAGSTFPRRIKAEDPNPEPQKDGLCEDTEKRFTYPRRVKPENELLLPEDKKNLSTSDTTLKSAAPVGPSVITCFEGKGVKDKEMKTEAQVHDPNHGTPMEKVKNKDDSSDSSSDSDNDGKQQNGAQHLIKHSDKKILRNGQRPKSFLERKRSKSLYNSLEEDIPEYSKPVKRTVSNPSFVARQRMVQKDERFKSLDTWRATIPEPDYPNDIPSARLHEEDDNAPPSYATSDSGVECLDALSGHDDESINHCDSVPESPGISSQLKDDNHLSSLNERRYQDSKHITNTADRDINGFHDNAVIMTTKDHTALIDANALKDSPSPFGVNHQGNFFQSTPTENKPRDISSPYRDPKLALRSTSPALNTVSSSGLKTTERIQTKDAEQMDFRSVKLRPTSTHYEQSHSFKIYGANHENKVSSDKKKEQPTSLEQQRSKNRDTESPLRSGQSITINNATDGPKDHYILPGSKKPTNDTEKNVKQIDSSQDTNKEIGFQRFHLRETPQSLKQHIAFREEMEPRTLTDTHTKEENSNGDKTEKDNETVIGVLDGIKRFQSQSAQAPKPMFGSHYISKKDPDQKPVHIISKEPNSKPVIVVPEPPAMTRETHKTTSRNVTEVKVNQNANVPTFTNKKETARPVSVINESVVPEDRRHFRYSTGNVNQSHVSLGFKDALIRGLDEEKTNTTSNKQDSLDKPVALVAPQSPKARRETAEERAAFEEERKKNWKREQIEQKLTSVHMRSVQNRNEQILQASGLAYRSCMPELVTKIKQIGEEREEAPVS